jgi:serine/threonine protein kinase
MSDHMQTIYSEIRVWERVAHDNIVKIFEMFDDCTHDDMYLLMELAKYG